jgi:hypothetical protein
LLIADERFQLREYSINGNNNKRAKTLAGKKQSFTYFSMLTHHPRREIEVIAAVEKRQTQKC